MIDWAKAKILAHLLRKYFLQQFHKEQRALRDPLHAEKEQARALLEELLLGEAERALESFGTSVPRRSPLSTASLGGQVAPSGRAPDPSIAFPETTLRSLFDVLGHLEEKYIVVGKVWRWNSWLQK